MSYVAYDFGKEIHVLELDEFGAHIEGGPVDLLGCLSEGPRATLEAAGWRIVGAAVHQGDHTEVEVVRV